MTPAADGARQPVETPQLVVDRAADALHRVAREARRFRRLVEAVDGLDETENAEALQVAQLPVGRTRIGSRAVTAKTSDW